MHNSHTVWDQRSRLRIRTVHTQSRLSRIYCRFRSSCTQYEGRKLRQIRRFSGNWVPRRCVGALHYRWEILVRCGDRSDTDTGATWGAATTDNGWFEAPDNAAVDSMGRLWIATDSKTSGTRNNGLWAMETDGALRGTGKHFFGTPVGAELCGPRFTPDDRALFVSVQHPGDAGVKKWGLFSRAATFEDPATRWPDFEAGMPPRPSVVVITKKDGGPIGT